MGRTYATDAWDGQKEYSIAIKKTPRSQFDCGEVLIAIQYDAS